MVLGVPREVTAAGAAPVREEFLLTAARTCTLIALVGAFTNPIAANWGAGLMLLAFACLPTAGARLRSVLRDPLPRAALLLLAVLALSMLWSAAPWSERFAHFWSWRTLLALIVSNAVFDSRAWKLRLVLTLVAATLIGAVAAWITWALDYRVFPIHPAGSVLRDGVTQGLAFAVGAFLAAVTALFEVGLAPRLRIALIGAAVALAASLFFVTAGRSAQIGVMVMTVAAALLLLQGRSRGIALVAIPVVFAAGVLLAPMAKERFALGWQEAMRVTSAADGGSVGFRLLLWRETAGLIAERPLLGYGSGGFAPAYNERVTRKYTDWRRRQGTDPHNQYLWIQARAGVLGTLAFAWFLLAAARQRAPEPWRAAALAILAMWCTTSLANSHFESFNEGHMIALLLGCLLARESDRRDQSDSARNTTASTSSEAGHPFADPTSVTRVPHGRVAAGSVTPNTLTSAAPTAAARWPEPLSLATTSRLPASSAAKVPTSVSASSVALGVALSTASRSPGPGQTTTFVPRARSASASAPNPLHALTLPRCRPTATGHSTT
jgi:O-antigen ligase